MNGKVWSKPTGMDYKKFYCHKCGERLVKEKTHRVVTQDDRDYYSYHDRGHFPKHDYDVYEYRFKCPSCEARITYDDQRIIKMIQKKCMRKRLSSVEINRNRKECEKRIEKRALFEEILGWIIFAIIVFSIYYLLDTDRTEEDLVKVVVFISIFTLFMVIGRVKKHKGVYKSKSNKPYSYEELTILKRLHTYSTHNKELVASSERCYCFYCKNTFESSEIKAFADDGQTAVCPNCLTDSIIPDSVDETIDENTLSMMQEYWF